MKRPRRASDHYEFYANDGRMLEETLGAIGDCRSLDPTIP